VAQLLADLKALHTRRPLAWYGEPIPGAFDHPVTLRWGWRKVTIGGPARVPGMVYVRLSNGSLHLMRTPTLAPSARNLLDRRLFPHGIGRIMEIDLTGPGTALHAKRVSDGWRLTAPVPSAADSLAIGWWLTQLATLTGEPGPPPPRTKGWDLTLTDQDGVTLSAHFTADGMATIGENGWRMDDDPKSVLPDRFRFMAKEVMHLDASAITALQVQKGDRIRYADLTPKGWLMRDNGLYYNRWAKGFFARLSPYGAAGVVSGDGLEMGPATLEVRMLNGKVVAATLELWRMKDRGWRARGGEKVTIFEVDGEMAKYIEKLFF